MEKKTLLRRHSLVVGIALLAIAAGLLRPPPLSLFQGFTGTSMWSEMFLNKGDMSLVTKANVNGTTFKATSNPVSPTAVNVSKVGVSLETAMRQNKAFIAAFEPNDKTSDQNKPKTSVQPVIIQLSKNLADDHDIKVIAAPRGLVSAITSAYNGHHNLILRPDDIWQAILTQFSFYVTGNAEKLRDKFVNFSGKKKLVVKSGGTLWTADFGKLSNRMVDEQIVKNIKDPDVAEWLLPNFTTTTPSDRVAASVSVMSTLQAYFEYVISLYCGIPKVTLEGTLEDWQKLRQKLDRLPDYDLEMKHMTRWYNLLTPVVDAMVSSVAGKPNLDFWDTICHHEGGGSGPTYLSGWVTVFACFTKDGTWQGFGMDHQDGANKDGNSPFKYPSIDTSRLPIGACTVPVLVDDNGIQYNTQMLAGQIAYEAVDYGGSGQTDTIRPRTDWCIAYDGEPNSDPHSSVQV